MDPISCCKKIAPLDIGDWNKLQRGVINWELVMNNLCDECYDVFIYLTKRQKRRPKKFMEKVYNEHKFIITFD